MEKIRYIYTTAGAAIDEIIADKQELFAEMLSFCISFIVKFGKLDNFLEFIECLIDYYIEYIDELNREQDIYIAIKEYLCDLSQEEITLVMKDEDFLEELVNIFDFLEPIVYSRIEEYLRVYGYYIELLSGDNIADKSYRLIRHVDILTEEKKNKVLSVIPKE